MFNTKRIIFLIGLLSLVTLTGALLAGPAFAKGPKSSVCHWQEFQDSFTEVIDEETTKFHEEEPAGWVVINISDSALPAHLGDEEVEAHNNGAGMDDMLIDDSEFAAENTVSSDDCGGGR
ncbi:MAG: hypothetical protein IH870_07290 [Chloroflexi bacterium]|nr:hypothetical protein [Chloroflexota bacterium]